MKKRTSNKQQNKAINYEPLLCPVFSPNYKRNKHPIIIRFIGLWRILTRRNFILIDFYETTTDGKASRQVRTLYRSDYDAESEFLTLKASLLSKMDAINGA
jgi:hypothetical protein